MDFDDEQICARLACYIKMTREQKGITQKQAAKALEVTEKTIHRLERGCGRKPVSAIRNLKTMSDFGGHSFIDFLFFLLPNLESEMNQRKDKAFNK